MFPLNLDIEEAQQLSDIFQCRFSKFPFKYLGVSLSDKPLKVADQGVLVDKVRTKLQDWKGKMLSLGGAYTD